jgi:hypothetical protein
MRAVLALRLFGKLTAYYVAVTAVVLIALRLFPYLREYMPFGGVEALMSGPRTTGLDGMLAPSPAAAEIGNLRESLYWLTITILGALLTALPGSWVYIAIRNPKLVIEMKGRDFNIKKFIDQLPPGEDKPVEGETKPLKLIINDLQVRGAQVVFRPDVAARSALPGIGDQLKRQT